MLERRFIEGFTFTLRPMSDRLGFISRVLLENGRERNNGWFSCGRIQIQLTSACRCDVIEWLYFKMLLLTICYCDFLQPQPFYALSFRTHPHWPVFAFYTATSPIPPIDFDFVVYIRMSLAHLQFQQFGNWTFGRRNLISKERISTAKWKEHFRKSINM